MYMIKILTVVLIVYFFLQEVLNLEGAYNGGGISHN